VSSGTDVTPKPWPSPSAAPSPPWCAAASSGERLRIALGRDNRLTSNELAAASPAGIRGAGLDVLDVGTVPTPALSFAVALLETDASLQVTGSHNPPSTTGSRSIWAALALGRCDAGDPPLIETEDYESGDGVVEIRDVLPIYVETLAGKFTVSRAGEGGRGLRERLRQPGGGGAAGGTRRERGGDPPLLRVRRDRSPTTTRTRWWTRTWSI
jgi:hypothetical protein